MFGFLIIYLWCSFIASYLILLKKKTEAKLLFYPSPCCTLPPILYWKRATNACNTSTCDRDVYMQKYRPPLPHHASWLLLTTLLWAFRLSHRTDKSPSLRHQGCWEAKAMIWSVNETNLFYHWYLNKYNKWRKKRLIHSLMCMICVYFGTDPNLWLPEASGWNTHPGVVLQLPAVLPGWVMSAKPFNYI